MGRMGEGKAGFSSLWHRSLLCPPHNRPPWAWAGVAASESRSVGRLPRALSPAVPLQVRLDSKGPCSRNPGGRSQWHLLLHKPAPVGPRLGFPLSSFPSPKHNVEETQELEAVIPVSGSSIFLPKMERDYSKFR